MYRVYKINKHDFCVKSQKMNNDVIFVRWFSILYLLIIIFHYKFSLMLNDMQNQKKEGFYHNLMYFLPAFKVIWSIFSKGGSICPCSLMNFHIIWNYRYGNIKCTFEWKLKINKSVFKISFFHFFYSTVFVFS